jgi:hypothetical protein
LFFVPFVFFFCIIRYLISTTVLVVASSENAFHHPSPSLFCNDAVCLAFFLTIFSFATVSPLEGGTLRPVSSRFGSCAPVRPRGRGTSRRNVFGFLVITQAAQSPGGGGLRVLSAGFGVARRSVPWEG